eukprot:TRINITY_DN3664_c0_g2_i5.p3 TRINITY_DN3664_c0_g2~~TRINITY_DN3664_c0_g2_i5.p3  ORF type:complete len:100 (-),score=0.34 TRINITY_DN3664_c0_g2_i5:22-321(-)
MPTCAPAGGVAAANPPRQPPPAGSGSTDPAAAPPPANTRTAPAESTRHGAAVHARRGRACGQPSAEAGGAGRVPSPAPQNAGGKRAARGRRRLDCQWAR